MSIYEPTPEEVVEYREDMTRIEQFKFKYQHYGIEATRISNEAEDWGLNELDVAQDIAAGLTEGQALMGRAIQQGNEWPAFDSSIEYYNLVDGLDGDTENESTGNAYMELLNAATTDGNNVELVGSTEGGEFNFGFDFTLN